MKNKAEMNKVDPLVKNQLKMLTHKSHRNIIKYGMEIDCRDEEYSEVGFQKNSETN